MKLHFAFCIEGTFDKPTHTHTHTLRQVSVSCFARLWWFVVLFLRSEVVVRPVSWHPCLFAHEAFFFRTVCPIRLGGGSRVRQHNINGSVFQKSHSHILYVVRMGFPPPQKKKRHEQKCRPFGRGPGKPNRELYGTFQPTISMVTINHRDEPILQVGPHSDVKLHVTFAKRDLIFQIFKILLPRSRSQSVGIDLEFSCLDLQKLLFHQAITRHDC